MQKTAWVDLNDSKFLKGTKDFHTDFFLYDTLAKEYRDGQWLSGSWD